VKGNKEITVFDINTYIKQEICRY